MATTTTRLALRKPNPAPGGDNVSVANDLNANWDKLDSAVSFTVCTNATRPATPFQGQAIFETDTGNSYVCSNATGPVWTLLSNSLSLAIVRAALYPIGCIYTATVSTNPATTLGFGTWSAITDRMLIGASGTYAGGSTGGAATTTLTTTELPAHTHSFSATSSSDGSHKHEIGIDNVIGTGTGEFTINNPGDTNGEGGSITNGTFAAGGHTHTLSGTSGSAGTGSAFSRLPPYLAVYYWTRTA